MQPLTWKPPIATADAPGAELAGDRHGAGKLVGLDADQTNEAGMARLIDSSGDPLDRDPDVHLVVGVDLDRDVVSQNLAGRAILGDRVDASH